MSITDELRAWVARKFPVIDKEWHDEFTAIANRIDAEHERVVRERRRSCVYYDPERHYCSCHDFDVSGYVELPKDADGEVIRVGDMMERGKARGHVIALMLSNYPKKWGGELHWGVQLEGEQAPTALDAFFHHYHKPTVEDVLRECCYKYHSLLVDDMNDAINGVERDYIAPDEIIAEYADKLRLAGDAE